MHIIHIRTFQREDSLSDCASSSHTSLYLFVNSRPLSLRHPLRTKKGSGDRVQQPLAVGKMRVAGDVLVRRPRGGQRQDHPPRRCPDSVHARRRGYLPRAREWSWDTTGTQNCHVVRVNFRKKLFFFARCDTFYEEQSQIEKKCGSLIFLDEKMLTRAFFFSFRVRWLAI